MQWWKISIFFDWLFPCIHLFSLLECCHLEQALSQMLNLKGFNSSWTKEIYSLKSMEIIKIQKQFSLFGQSSVLNITTKTKRFQLDFKSGKIILQTTFLFSIISVSQEISSWSYLFTHNVNWYSELNSNEFWFESTAPNVGKRDPKYLQLKPYSLIKMFLTIPTS